MRFRNTLLGACCLFSFALFGQSLSPSVVASSGSSVTNSNLTMDFTIGEVMIAHYGINGQLSLGQGFLQTYLKVVPTFSLPNQGFTITVFPNPASDQLHVRMDKQVALSIRLSDVRGKVLLRRRVQGFSEILNIEDLSSGMYVLQCFVPSGQLLKSFSIIKP